MYMYMYMYITHNNTMDYTMYMYMYMHYTLIRNAGKKMRDGQVELPYLHVHVTSRLSLI